MHALEMRRLVSTLSPLIFILIVVENYIPKTSATFFVEVTDKQGSTMKVSLYECDSTNGREVKKSPSRRSQRSKNSKSPSPSPPKEKDIMCFEVKNRDRKVNIYSTANFYLITHLVLDGGKRVILPSRSRTGSTFPPFSILVGVTIVGGQEDSPPFLDADREGEISSLRYKCQAAQLIGNFLDEKNVDEFVSFLGAAHFGKFFHPSEDVLEHARLFNKVVQQVEEFYSSVVPLGQQKKVDRQKELETQRKVAPAVKLLMLKLFDPCLFFPITGEMDSKKRTKAMEEAGRNCHIYCQFLAVGFLSNRIGSSSCSSLVTGVCSQHRCWCEKFTKEIFGKPVSTTQYVRMIQCSNDLRIGISAVTNTNTKFSALASLRTFRRTLTPGKWLGLT